MSLCAKSELNISTMASLLRPPFDRELAEILKYIPPNEALTWENVMQKRESIKPICVPEAVFTDPEIKHEEVTISRPSGNVELSIIRRKKSAGGLRPAFYWIHGGGMLLGTRHFLLGQTFVWVKHLDAVLISVEYRLAPEHPSPANLDDCYAGLEWVAAHTSELSIDSDRVMIAGASSGGGLAAGVALMARDRKGPKLCAQLLLYGMLDDLNDTVSTRQFWSEGTWTGRSNLEAWNLLFSGRRNTDNVTIYASPARAQDLSGLPPAFIDVGSAEVFRDENVVYVSKLWECGVQAELHIWPGAWHGYDFFGPKTEVSKVALETRMRWMQRIFKIPNSASVATGER
ncbi:alpha/beta-hydrolase [Stipitochalara longipes BDJ]|nr:alpha/beta-hydrolase [Stipitochalara longipes BDJ]